MQQRRLTPNAQPFTHPNKNIMRYFRCVPQAKCRPLNSTKFRSSSWQRIYNRYGMRDTASRIMLLEAQGDGVNRR